MQRVSRRGLVLGSAAASAGLLLSRRADATLVRGLTLRAMLDRTHHVVVVSALESYSHELEIGGRRSIVTDSRVKIEDVLAKRAPRDGELIVRTLGGRVGNVGEIVHGQPELSLGSPALTFLKLGADGAHWVVGMAQGHYPLDGGVRETARLSASRNLPTVRDWQKSAVRTLVGQQLRSARVLVRTAAEP